MNAPLWTLDELSAQVALALANGYVGQASGRVRDVPDARTIRYYTTLGLIDRPAELRGRTALYGRRHLLQLVAIKRLQANGSALAEVQARLLGATDVVLARIARIEGEPGNARAARAQEKKAPARERFWATDPAEPQTASSASAPPQPTSLTALPLAEGVTLLVAAGRPLDEYDLAGLREAAGPLMKYLHARRVLGENT